MNRKKHLFLIFLITLIALVLVACAENDAEETPEPTAETEAIAEPTEAPAEPTAAPTEPPAEPTAEPTVAPTDVPVTQEPAQERLGLLRFRDAVPAEGAADASAGAGAEGEESGVIRAGSYQLLMQGISPAPAGSHYELWLVDDNFNTLNLGQFAAEGDVDVSGSAAENLLGSYSAAFISIEPDDVDDGEIGPHAYNGVIPAQSLLHVRHVVTAFDGNPDGKAFLIGAEEQLLLAIEHTGFILDELAADNIREAQRHAEHVVNILDGENGATFGDLDGDSAAQNPGDGVGLRGYLEGAKQHAQLASDAEGATAEVKLHAGHVQISSDNILARLDAAIDEALRVIASDTASEAQPTAETLAQILDQAYTGQDVDGDGAIAPIEGEGGWQTAYEHALNMGSFEFFDANPATAAEQGASAPPADAAPDDPEAEEDPEAEPAPPPAPVTIDMANFAFEPGDITVPVGTAVTWANRDDGARHSATASDGSFDTGLLDPGQEATITFDTPGTYIYYCTLHGSPDGSGMAATITVTE